MSTYQDFLASKALRAKAHGLFPLPDWLLSSSKPEPLAALRYVPSRVPVFIYGLIDPRTSKIRYIGKTIQPPAARIRAHMQDRCNCHRVHWLQQLAALSLRPEFVALECLEGGWPWQEAERYWIAYGRRNGWPLTNNTSGGDGTPDLPFEVRERMRATWIGRKHSAETKEKISAYRKTWRASPETKEKMRVAHTGRKILWVDKIAATNRKLTPEQAEEITRRRNAGETAQALAREFGVHRTTLSKIKTGTYFSPKDRR